MKMKSEKKTRREAPKTFSEPTETIQDEIEFWCEEGNKFVMYLQPSENGYLVFENAGAKFYVHPRTNKWFKDSTPVG